MVSMLIMNGILISLIFIWTSAAREPSAEHLIKSPVELPTGPLINSLSETQVSLNENPMEIRQRRKNSCRRKLEGKCVRNNRRCPSSLPSETSRGKPYCSKKKRCCYPEATSCEFNSMEDRREFLKLWPGMCPEADADCEWNWDTSFPAYRPLILGSRSRIQLPVKEDENEEKILRVLHGSRLTFACSGITPELKKNALEEFNEPAVNAKCDNGKIRVDNHQDLYDMEDMGCKSNITSTTRPLDQKCGVKGNYQIAFETFKGTFYQMMEFCFDKTKETTIWSKNIIHGRSLSAKDKSVRPKFSDPGGIFTPSMKNIYNPEEQFKFFSQILGPNNNIINEEKRNYFSRGHMAPKSDFVTWAEQRATFNYINALPQWQIFNEDNWGNIETDIQAEAGSLGTDMTIVTGGYNILQLGPPGEIPIQIYLGNIDPKPEAKKKVPIPDIVWKAVFEESTNIEVVFVITNNPVLLDEPNPLCTDICEDIDWITEETRNQFSDQTKGFTYCCTVEDFKASFPDIQFPTV